MKTIAIPAEVRELLDAANYAHLTTLQADGSPRNHVVWIWREDDHVIVATSPGHRKAMDMDRDPRVSLSLVDQANPYRMAALRGQVVEVWPDDKLQRMDRIAIKYTSQPFPDRDIELVYYVIAITSAYERTLNGFEHNPADSFNGRVSEYSHT